MKEYIVRLIPKSSFELELHSDTLFGAICWGIRTLYGEEMLVKILDGFVNKKPLFLLSSAFPYKNIKNKFVYFLPKPILPSLNINQIVNLKEKSNYKIMPYNSEKISTLYLAEKYKKFKKIKWIPIDRIKVDQLSELNLFIDYLDNYIEELSFASFGISQKNMLDRLSNSTSGSGEVFYTSEIKFRSKYGLYFLIRTQNLESYLKPVLLFLRDSGIGPNARTGKNWFDIEIEESLLVSNEIDGTAFMSLSRFFGIDRFLLDNSYYHLETVKSKVESRFEFAGEDIWKDRVNYFSEGSVLCPEEKKPFYGGIIPVKEVLGKKIYQYGYAYPLWLSLGGNNGV